MNEKSYRNQYDKPLDWLTFNAQYVETSCGEEIANGSDPSFTSKSGKHSHGWDIFILVVQININEEWKLEVLQQLILNKIPHIIFWQYRL